MSFFPTIFKLCFNLRTFDVIYIAVRFSQSIHAEDAFWLASESGRQLAPVRFNGIVFAVKMHSTSKFDKTVLRKCVYVCACMLAGMCTCRDMCKYTHTHVLKTCMYMCPLQDAYVIILHVLYVSMWFMGRSLSFPAFQSCTLCPSELTIRTPHIVYAKTVFRQQDKMA